jgi:Tol biopolymer transport system component
MTIFSRSLLAAPAGLAVMLLLARPGASQGCATSLQTSTGSSDVWGLSLSSDGRFLAYQTQADGIVPGDTNNDTDAFVRDLQTGIDVMASVDPSGAHSVGAGSQGLVGTTDLSDDGRYLAFTSGATNLVPGAGGGQLQVYRRDLVVGVTELVSADVNGGPGDAGSEMPSISGDGRWVAFQSSASDLVPNDTNALLDVFLRDLLSGVTVRVSVATGGVQVGFGSGYPSVSDDGSLVVFESGGLTLVPGDTNGRYDVFLHDVLAATTTRVSIATGGTQANGHSNRAAISGDGSRVVFASEATNLVQSDVNGYIDVFLRDLVAGTTELVSRTTAGGQGNQHSGVVSTGGARLPVQCISNDGRFVGFPSAARNLVPADTNGTDDAFVRDTLLQVTERVSLDGANVQGDWYSHEIALANGGALVAFSSSSTNWIAGPPVLQRRRIFTRPRGTLDVNGDGVTDACEENGGAPFCFADFNTNGGPPCPCGNDVMPSILPRGCRNSTGSGARLAGNGRTSVSNDLLVFTSSAMPGMTTALLVQGDQVAGNWEGVLPFNDGHRCVEGNLLRLGTSQASGGTATFGATGATLSQRGQIPPQGGSRWYQVVYRNNAGPCNTLANSTNGVAVVWTP